MDLHEHLSWRLTFRKRTGDAVDACRLACVARVIYIFFLSDIRANCEKQNFVPRIDCTQKSRDKYQRRTLENNRIYTLRVSRTSYRFVCSNNWKVYAVTMFRSLYKEIYLSPFVAFFLHFTILETYIPFLLFVYEVEYIFLLQLLFFLILFSYS